MRALHGLLFAYMGPPKHMPPLPVYDTFTGPPGNRLAPFSLEYPCNWLQVIENAADPIHNAYLHAIVSGLQFSAAFREFPFSISSRRRKASCRWPRARSTTSSSPARVT